MLISRRELKHFFKILGGEGQKSSEPPHNYASDTNRSRRSGFHRERL